MIPIYINKTYIAEVKIGIERFIIEITIKKIINLEYTNNIYAIDVNKQFGVWLNKKQIIKEHENL